MNAPAARRPSIHGRPPSRHGNGRCQLCGANDREGLIERLAGRLWESRVDDDIRREWATCPPHWRMLMIDHATVAIDMLEGK